MEDLRNSVSRLSINGNHTMKGLNNFDPESTQEHRKKLLENEDTLLATTQVISFNFSIKGFSFLISFLFKSFPFRLFKMKMKRKIFSPQLINQQKSLKNILCTSNMLILL